MIRSAQEFTGLGRRSAPIAEALRSDIMDGTFGAGSKLPSLHELCRRFKVTRPTLRKAVAQLVRENRVIVRAGAGMFVCRSPETAPGTVSRTISVMFHFDTDSLYSIQQMAMGSGFLLCTYSQSDAYWDPAHERAFLEAVKSERRRALIAFCTPREPRNEDLLAELEALGTRVVHIEPYSPALPAQNYIIPDYEYAGAMAATELLLSGCRSTAYLPMNVAPFEQLLERGFARALTDHGSGYEAARDRRLIERFESPADPAARDLGAWLATRPRPMGLFCRAPHNAAAVRTVLDAAGLTDSRDYRLITFSQESSPSHAVCNELVVSRMDLVRRAIKAVAVPDWKGVRELVKPTLIRLASTQGRP